MTWQTNSISSEQTELLGELLAKHLRPPAVIELVADLGGGKTTLVKGLARGLGVAEPITSPTFTISREYNGTDQVLLHHFDFYRLNEAGVVAEALDESINNKRVITVVEWGDIVHDVLPAERLKISIALSTDSDLERQINISYTPHYQQVILATENDWKLQ